MEHADPLAVVVGGLLVQSGMTGRELARRAGIASTTLNRRLNLGGWKVDEVAQVAAVFDLTASQLAALAEERAA